MSIFDETKVEIEKLDNGYVLEWRKPHNDEVRSSWLAPKTDGREIHTTLKSALNAAENYLA